MEVSRIINPVPRSFYSRDTYQVAVELLGKILFHQSPGGVAAGRIVETEAYLGKTDPSSHAFRGVTRRNEVMFGPAGCAYVYFVYGNHYCFNVVAHEEEAGEAGAVLVRALKPLEGIPLMRRRRWTEREYELTNGPGKLTQALGISRNENGAALYTRRGQCYLLILDAPPPEENIVTAPRVGISRAEDLPYRFALEGNPFVSRPHPW